jgi:carbonic anhydrase
MVLLEPPLIHGPNWCGFSPPAVADVGQEKASKEKKRKKEERRSVRPDETWVIYIVVIQLTLIETLCYSGFIRF